jgi:hypothetical protein
MAPHAQTQKVSAVVLPSGASDEMVNVKPFSAPAHRTKLELVSKGR